MQAAAFTLLNPHVYLDTVLLVGSVGAQQPARAAFVGGAVASSLLWFGALGWGARALAPWFARPGAWRLLDLAVGATMLLLAALLAVRAFS
jgi:L-lysine exporter family protein LysE/ArgO